MQDLFYNYKKQNVHLVLSNGKEIDGEVEDVQQYCLKIVQSHPEKTLFIMYHHIVMFY